MTTIVPTMVLRTEPSYYWIMVGIPAVVFVLSATGIPTDSGFWFPTMATALMVVTAWFWGKTTRLSLACDAIHYRSFLRRVDIALADVTKVEYAAGFIAFSYKSYKRIVITVRETSGDKNIVLNGGLFDPHKIKQWVNLCSSALNKKSKD